MKKDFWRTVPNPYIPKYLTRPNVHGLSNYLCFSMLFIAYNHLYDFQNIVYI